MTTVRMRTTVTSQTGQTLFKQGKEYAVLRTLPEGSVVAMSERDREEGIFASEYDREGHYECECDECYLAHAGRHA